MGAIFSPPKPKAPPPPPAIPQETLDLQKAQTESLEKQSKALDKKEVEEKRKKTSRDKVVASRRGRRGLGTLFSETGELGVTFGGAGK